MVDEIDLNQAHAQFAGHLGGWPIAHGVKIENLRVFRVYAPGNSAKLLTRHWIITDANGKVQEVHGKGVVGEQPELAPGESYQYTSGTMIETPVGTMGGSYQMVDEAGDPFDAEIPEFVLSVPRTLH
jgi:uncharacterized protein affecting Mg2+/Co2+ transport